MSTRANEPIENTAAAHSPAEPDPQAETARPLRTWTVFAVFLATAVAAVLAQIPVVIVLVAIKAAGGNSPEGSADIMATPWDFVAVAFPAQLAILFMWWLASSFGDPRARVHRAIGKSSLPWAGYVCFAWASLGVLWLGGLLGQAGATLLGNWESDMFGGIYKSMTWPSGIVFVLFIALVPSFAEELYFRGYMQRRLMARWSPAVAVLVVAILFAAFHGTPVWALSVFPLGLGFGILAYRTASLWPGIACHAFVNGSVNLWRVGVALDVLPSDISPMAYYLGLGIALTCLVLSLWYLYQHNRNPAEIMDATS